MTATVAATYVRALLDFAVSRGASRDGLVQRAGVNLHQLEDGEGRIPFATYLALLRAAKTACNDPALALHFGEEVDMSQLTLVGLTSKPTGSLTDDAASLNRYAPLALDVGAADRFQFDRIDGKIWIIDNRCPPFDTPEITESFFARAVSGMRRWFSGRQLINEVHVKHAAPPYRAEYDRIFRVPVTFNSDRNAMQVSDELWSLAKTAWTSGYASKVLGAHADSLLAKLESSKSMRGRVESLLMPALQSGDTSIEAVAKKIGVSRQTLFRKLKAEGITFAKLLDELRHRMALHYLNEKKMAVNETAYLVGFSDPAAFSRAFKRWTGSSPGASKRSRR
jgi:AraC-like DNA-binding protein